MNKLVLMALLLAGISITSCGGKKNDPAPPVLPTTPDPDPEPKNCEFVIMDGISNPYSVTAVPVIMRYDAGGRVSSYFYREGPMNMIYGENTVTVHQKSILDTTKDAAIFYYILEKNTGKPLYTLRTVFSPYANNPLDLLDSIVYIYNDQGKIIKEEAYNYRTKVKTADSINYLYDAQGNIIKKSMQYMNYTYTYANFPFSSSVRFLGASPGLFYVGVTYQTPKFSVKHISIEYTTPIAPDIPRNKEMEYTYVFDKWGKLDSAYIEYTLTNLSIRKDAFKMHYNCH